MRPRPTRIVPPVVPDPPAPASPPPSPSPVLAPRRHHRIRWTVIIVATLVVLILGTGGWLAYRAISVVNTKKTDGSNVSLFQQLAHLVSSGNDQLQGEADDRINVLLLGYGGSGHEGPYLTDTMMVISYKPSTKQLAMLSIPRDLVVDIPGYGYRKINGVLSFGRDRDYPGGGEALATKTVSDLLNIPIHYYGRVDFQGFKNVIDQVGGVNVTVDTAFTDYRYPDNNYGYEPVTFKAGTQVMDGDRALKFARSRKGNNGEGSDFARAKRQQKIIEGLKDKLFSLGIITNPKRISDILGTLGSHTQTNMEVWEMLRFARLTSKLDSAAIINTVYDDSEDGFLRATTGVDGAFILVPRDGDYTDMQFMAQEVFLAHAAAAEQANVMVMNATTYTSLATTVGRGMTELGLSMIKTGSLSKTTVGQTVIVATTPGKFPATESLLTAYTHAGGTLSASSWSQQTGDQTLTALLATPIRINTNSTVITNGRSTTTNTSTTVLPDLIVVLGQDQPKPGTGLLIPTTTKSTTTNTNTQSTNTNARTNTNSKTNTNATQSNTNTTSSDTNASTTNLNTNS